MSSRWEVVTCASFLTKSAPNLLLQVERRSVTYKPWVDIDYDIWNHGNVYLVAVIKAEVTFKNVTKSNE